MKKVLFCLIIVFLVSNGFAQTKVKWYDIEEAEELAKKDPRPLFIDVYTDWCGWCKVMDKDTFSNDVIAGILNNKFYPVKFNAESFKTIKFKGKVFENKGSAYQRRSSHGFTKELFKNSKGGFPSFVFYTHELEHYFVLSGFRKPEAIESILEYVGDKLYKSQKFDDFSKTFKSNLKKQ